MDSNRVSSLSRVEPRFHALRKRLDQLGYTQTLGIESFPLVERLFNDISLSNENLRKLQDLSYQSQKHVDVLSKSVEPYKKENSRLLSENNKLRHQLLTSKERAESVTRDNRTVQRKGEQQLADLQFLVAQYVKKVHRLETENAEKSKKILQLQEKNLQAVILTPGGKKQAIPFRRQRLEIEQPPASLANPSTLPHVVTQVKDVYVADMVKMAESALDAERNRYNQLQSKIDKCEEEKNAIKEQVEVRDLEIQRLSKLLESGLSPENMIYKEEMAEQTQKIEQLKLQIEALESQNEELRVMRPDKEPPLTCRMPKPSSLDTRAKQALAPDNKRYIGREKRIEEELWDQLKELKRKFSALQTEHESCAQKTQELRFKLGSKDEHLAKLEVLIQKINKEKEQLGVRVHNLTANEKSLLQELGRLTTEAKASQDGEKGSRSLHQLEEQLESLTEYVHQLETQRDHYREEVRGLLRLMPQSRSYGMDPESDGNNHIDPRELEAKLKLVEEERNFFRRNYQELLADNLTKSERRRAPSGCVTTTDKGISAVDEEVEELRKQKQEAERIVEVLQERLDQAQDSIMNLLKEKETLMQEVESRQTQTREDYQRESQSSRSSGMSSSEVDNPLPYTEIRSRSHSSEAHETDHREVSGSNSTSAHTQIIQLGYDVKQAQEESQRLREALEKAEQEMHRLHDVVKATEDELAASERQKKEKEEQLVSLQASAESQEVELLSLHNLLERVQQERDAALTASAAAHQAEHLQDQQRQEAFGIQAILAQVDSRIQELQLEVRRRETELSSVREQLRIEKEKCDRLEEQKENIRKENRRTLDDLMGMTSQLQKVGQELDTVQEEKVTLQRQIQDYVTEVTRIQELLSIKEQERLELLEQYAHLSSEHIELERQHSTLEMQSDSVVGILANKDIELLAFQDTISSLENEIQQHLMAQETMTSQVDQLNGSVTELGTELGQVTAEADTLKKELETARQRCGQLEMANGQLQRQVNVSQNDKELLTNRQEEIQQEMCELREQLVVLRGHISQLETLLVSCRENEYRHQTYSQVASSQAENLDRELQETKESLDSQRRGTLDLKNKLADLELQLDKLKRELTNEKFEKERAHQELRRYRQQHSCYVERHDPPQGQQVSEEQRPVTAMLSSGAQVGPSNSRGRLAASFRGTETGTRPKKIAFSTEEK